MFFKYIALLIKKALDFPINIKGTINISYMHIKMFRIKLRMRIDVARNSIGGTRRNLMMETCKTQNGSWRKGFIDI